MGRLALSKGKGPPVAADTTPDAFTIPAKTGQALDSDIWSADVTPTGYTNDAAISGTGLGVQINGGSTVSSGTISPGQSFKIGLHTSASNSTLVTATATVGGVSADFNGTTLAAAGSVAVIGPHAAWDGTAGSGDPAPDVPTQRSESDTPSKAMAMGGIMTASYQRATDNLLVKVPCRAAYTPVTITVSGDCEETLIENESLLFITGDDGVEYPEQYHAFYLDCPAFVAKAGSTGAREAHIYVTVNPVDTTNVQPRLLGPLIVYPDETKHDGTYNVGVGQTYTTTRAALSAAITDGKEAPLILLKDDGPFEMENSTWGIHAPTRYTRATIAGDDGTDPVLRRAADFNPTGASSWNWTPGWDGIEFRKLTFDKKNVSKIMMSARSCRFVGTIDTNSIGTRDSLYWNKSGHPGFGCSVASSWEYTHSEHGGPPTGGQLFCIGGDSIDTLGDTYTGTPIVYGRHDRNATGAWFRDPKHALTVRYSGSGTGTLEKTGENGGGSLVLRDAAGTLTIPLGAIDDLVDIADVGVAINARSGWAATVDDTTFSARFLYGVGIGTVNGFPETDAKSADINLEALWDIHGDGTQTYGGKENFIYWKWTVDGDETDYSNVIFLDGTTVHNWDLSFRWCALMPKQSGSTYVGGPGDQHLWFEDSTFGCGLTFRDGTGDSLTSALVNCVIGGGVGNLGSWPTTTIAVTNCAYVQSYLGAPTMANWTGNFTISDGFSMVVDYENGDMTPTSILLTNLKPKLDDYDMRGVLRSASDAVGAWSKNAA